MGSAEYYIRFRILRRVVTGQLSNGEPDETWPAPADGVDHYSAKPLALNAGEEIRQGVKESTNFLKLQIKGRGIAIEAVDRIELLPSGQVFRLTAAPVRLQRETVITCESI